MEILTNYAIDQIKDVLQKELTQADGRPVLRPKSLARLYAQKQREEKSRLVTQANLEAEATRRMTDFLCQADLSGLEALDLAWRSLLIQNQLEKLGSLYGNNSFNFLLSPIQVSKSTFQLISDTALEGLNTIKSCSPITESGQNIAETEIMKFGLVPNGARVDIILTDKGPRIIEINTQWVDAIQALQAMQQTYLGQPPYPLPVDTLGKQIKSQFATRVGIVDISRGSGSRKTGSMREMEILAKTLKAYGYFSDVELLDPTKTRPEYFREFQSFYVNGDPKMLGSYYPIDWLQYIYKTGNKIFPFWNPGYDTKLILIEAYQRKPDLFARTEKYSTSKKEGFVKGRGYSSNSVIYGASTPLDEDNNYVWQEDLPSVPLENQFGFDTSSGKPKFLQNPNSKLNVWIIGNKVVGIMVSASESKIISDKDFNCVPTIV